MTPMKITLSLIFLLMVEVALSVALHQERALITVNAGETVILPCFYEGDAAIIFSWYKQTLGRQPKLISTYFEYGKNAELVNEFKNDPRFSVLTSKGIHHLNITNLSVSDSATYYCAAFSNYVIEFAEGTFLNVNKIGSSIHAIVQQPVSTMLSPGDSVTLNCTIHTKTCAGEHSVYWFRHGTGESHPGILYTHGDRSGQFEKSPEAGSPTQSCVYHLPKRNLSLSDAGTYYCAVASCGEILFGDGTNLDIQDDFHPMVWVYCLEAAVALASIFVFILSGIVCKMNRRKCQLCKDHQTRTAAFSPAQGRESDHMHYAALSLNSQRNRPQRHRDTPETSVCVYSGIRE